MTRSLLHVGCGSKRIEHTTAAFSSGGWNEIRFDIAETAQPDVVGTMTDMISIESHSIDAIFSSHNLEHLYPHEVGIALREFHRVLKDDGFAIITCPDLQSVAELIAEDKLTDPAYISPAGPIAPIDILFGHRASVQSGNPFMAHHCGFTKRVLMACLQEAGFAAVAGMARPAHFDLWAVASRCPRSETEMRELASQHFPNS